MTNSYNERIVEYEHIHSISNQSFDCLFENIKINKNARVLDAGCGYGSISKQLLFRSKDFVGDVVLLDNSTIQLKRAIDNLAELDQVKGNVYFSLQNFIGANLKHNTFDLIICKMLLHEYPKDQQLNCIKMAYSLLKPGGELLIWDLALSEDTQLFFQEIINYKDKLANYSSLLENRYFPKENEILNYYSNAGFSKVRKICQLSNPVITSKRLGTEMKTTKDLHELNKYILEKAKHLNQIQLNKLKLHGDIENVTFTPAKAIFKGTK